MVRTTPFFPAGNFDVLSTISNSPRSCQCTQELAVVVRSGRRLDRIDPISGCARFVCQHIRRRSDETITCSLPLRACETARLLDVHSEPCQTPAARVGQVGLLHRALTRKMYLPLIASV